MGIRVALGAQSRDVVRLVLGQGMTPVVAGLGWGLASAWGTTQVLQSWLFGLTASDPWTYAAVSLLLASVALAVCYLPARRATRIDPMAALREE